MTADEWMQEILGNVGRFDPTADGRDPKRWFLPWFLPTFG